MRRLAAALALACLTASPSHAMRAIHHHPVHPETAGFSEIVALRIPGGQDSTRVGDDLPSRGVSLGGAFMGRDGRLCFWDADHRNLKIVAFPADGAATLTVTSRWAAQDDSLRIVDGDADSLGNVYLVSEPVPGRLTCRALAWTRANATWSWLDLPWDGGGADAAGSELRKGARVRALADGRVLLLPAGAPPGGRGWCVGGNGRFEPADHLLPTDAAELGQPRTDAHGRRLLRAEAGEIVLADAQGKPLASMAAPRRPEWKRMTAEPQMLEPGGTLVSLHATSRGLVVYRLIPEIDDVAALPGRVYGPAFKPPSSR
jgi:hypothetical protein